MQGGDTCSRDHTTVASLPNERLPFALNVNNGVKAGEACEKLHQCSGTSKHDDDGTRVWCSFTRPCAI
jgi:hypothetical protein